MSDSLILVTNDDGVTSPLMEILVEALEDVGEVWVYAPDRDQSAVGHGISLHRPLRVRRVRERWHMVDGTPTDCVMLAVRDLLDRKPDLVVSGINPGPNLGDDVTYSGTVAGAYEGMLLGIPSMAISCAKKSPSHVETAAHIARKLALRILEHGLPPDTVLNVNVPDVSIDALKGTVFTRMGCRAYQDEIIQRTDPHGEIYYWIGGSEPSHVSDSGTDFDAIESDKVSVTPLHRDLTNFEALGILKSSPLAL